MINNVSNSRKIMSRFGDLLKGETTTPEPTVVIEAPEPVEVKVDFGVMSKDELEDCYNECLNKITNLAF